MARTKPNDTSEVESRIRPASEVDPYAKVLVYGQNGSGKTRFAASAPGCLIVDINEHGTRSAAETDADVIEVNSWDDIGQVYWFLKAGNHKYESVALDTLTAMQAMAMSFVLDEAEERDPSREKRMPDKRSYGRAGTLMSGMIWAYRNLDMHVIFTAQVRTVRDPDTEEVLEYTVDLPASSRGSATGAVGVLGYLERKETKVRNKGTGKIEKRWIDTMRLGPDADYPILKDRTNSLGSEFKRPTMPKVIEAWVNTEEES